MEQVNNHELRYNDNDKKRGAGMTQQRCCSVVDVHKGAELGRQRESLMAPENILFAASTTAMLFF